MSQVRVLSPLLQVTPRPLVTDDRVPIAAVVSLATLLLGVGAVVDHRHKREVEFAAQEDAWFCSRGRPSACREFDEVAYEESWEQRELAYWVTFFALGASALGLAAICVRRRRG